MALPTTRPARALVVASALLGAAFYSGESLHADTAPDPLAVSAPAAGPSCPVRDPEDGSCHESADAADLAWLARANAAPARSRVLGAASPAASLAAASLASVLPAADDLPFEPDPDGDDDAEDGGLMAPVDAGFVARQAAPALPSLSPEEKSFWKRTAARVKGLVVRKADSKPASIPEEELAKLFDTGFPIPLEAFPKEKLRDSFQQSRGRHRKHHAIDLGAPRGTPVVAVCDGTVERLGRDRRGGLVVYQRDATGRFVYYYAHLSRHAPGLRVGDQVKRGQRLGDVGATGRASGPHLHFAIFRDAEAPSPWKGLVVNPYLVFSGLFRQ